jgi:hypothetical protein
MRLRVRGVCLASLWLAVCLGSSLALAEARWHCSRQPDSVGQNEANEDLDSFQLAAMGSRSRAIGITLTDLIEVYEGKPIWVNGRRLNACFMPGNSALSAQALQSLGLNASTMQLQSRRSAIVQSHLHPVSDEAGMQACLAKHFPAVGYLSRDTETQRFVPCF